MDEPTIAPTRATMTEQQLLEDELRIAYRSQLWRQHLIDNGGPYQVELAESEMEVGRLQEQYRTKHGDAYDLSGIDIDDLLTGSSSPKYADPEPEPVGVEAYVAP